jgi:O-antigen/teichoic acid export membrane protein
MRLKLFQLFKEDNFLSLGGNLVLAIFGFGVFALLARILDTNSFAEWVLFISGGSFVEMFRFGLTNNGLIRYLSGASEENSKRLIGSNVIIGFAISIAISFVLILVNTIFHDSIEQSPYRLFFNWYPLLVFLNLPWNNALVVLQARMDYTKMLIIKTLNSGLFFIIVLLSSFLIQLTIDELIWFLLGINLLTSILTIVKGWDGMKLIRKAHKDTSRQLLNFGKFSVFTLLGSNLLKNADIIIISLSPLGSAAVALYSIPLKLLEIIQIPLRSFTATAFPKMSKASLRGDKSQLAFLFNTYTGALFYLFVFIGLFFYVFAKELVVLVSGQQYLNIEVIGFDIVLIVKILAVYAILLPLDRMTGIGLDSINKPNINAIKVAFMVVTNVLGDLVAVFVFGSLVGVAIFTLVFTGIGIVLGFYFLKKEIKFSPNSLILSANNFYLLLKQKLA